MKKTLVLLSVPFQAVLFGGLTTLWLGLFAGLVVFTLFIGLGIKALKS